MTLNIILIVAAAISTIFSLLALGVSILALVELRAMKLSTHTIQWMNPEQLVEEDKKIEKINKEARSDYEDFGYEEQ